MKKQKVLTHTILLISFVSLFNDIATEMLYPVMPVYLKSIGFSVVLIGILEGLAEATAGLSKGYFGNLSDKMGVRMPFVRFGYFMSTIAKPMMAIFTFPAWIFFARTSDRFGKGVRTSARDAILSDETKPENKGKVFGFHRGMDTLGAAIGPVIALLYLYYNPGQYKWMFIIAFFPGLVSIIITFFINEKKKELKAHKQNINFFSYFKYWNRATLEYKKVVIGLLAFTLFNSSDAFLLLALKNNGMSDIHMIAYYIFYNLIFALFSYPVGHLADKIGLKTMLISGFVLFSIVYLAMGFSGSALFLTNPILIFGIIFFVYGIYAATNEGIAKALISNISDKSETATAIGFFTSFMSIFTMISSSLAGLIWFGWGPKWMFFISGGGVILTVIYFIAGRIKTNRV